MNDRCGGCNALLDVEKPVTSHERFGLLCPGCTRFTQECEREIRWLRETAEALAALDLLITVPRGGMVQ